MAGNNVLLKQFIITEMECVLKNLRKNKTICRMIAMILFVALVFPFITINSFAGTDPIKKFQILQSSRYQNEVSMARQKMIQS